jgi:hypothetical protein
MTAGPPGFAADPPPPAAVGAFVAGPPTGPRTVVRWADQYRDHHELAPGVDPDREAYLSLFAYQPAEYVRHFVRAGHSPRGYAGPAACRALLFDIDRPGDLPAALADARALVRFLRDRYGPHADDAVGVYYSGAKGFHVTLALLTGAPPAAAAPATAKRLALALAAAARVRVDPACYDHQRLVRLPNSKHPVTGLHKRFLTPDELVGLDAAGVRDLARYPAGYAVPTADEFIEQVETDWTRAAATAPAPGPATPGATGHPLVPKFVRDFIGFADVQDPGRAVTLFRCAAALAEAGTPPAVVAGLLDEPATRTGLDPAEVRKQIADGIARGRRAGGLPA